MTERSRRKLSELTDTLKAAALQYGATALGGGAEKLAEDAERKLKMVALLFYQATQHEEEDRAISTIVALDGEPEPFHKATNEAALGFADEKDFEVSPW